MIYVAGATDTLLQMPHDKDSTPIVAMDPKVHNVCQVASGLAEWAGVEPVAVPMDGNCLCHALSVGSGSKWFPPANVIRICMAATVAKNWTNEAWDNPNGDERTGGATGAIMKCLDPTCYLDLAQVEAFAMWQQINITVAYPSPSISPIQDVLCVNHTRGARFAYAPVNAVHRTSIWLLMSKSSLEDLEGGWNHWVPLMARPEAAKFLPTVHDNKSTKRQEEGGVSLKKGRLSQYISTGTTTR